MEQAGTITELKRQKLFNLCIDGVRICGYRADFTYYENGVFIVEDVKSKMTAKLEAYRIKKALMKAVLGIEIKEV